VTNIGKACACDQANVAGTYDRNIHMVFWKKASLSDT
jgi:hypothetical protein